MKTLSFLFYFLLQGIFLARPATGIVYYVKPTSPNTTNCTGQPCHTLQYYLDNVSTAINNQQNVTMILMSGTHATDLSIGVVYIRVPIMNMTGEGQGVVLNSNGYAYLGFNSFTEVSLSNIVIINWHLDIDTLMTSNMNGVSFAIENCTLIGGQLLVRGVIEQTGTNINQSLAKNTQTSTLTMSHAKTYESDLDILYTGLFHSLKFDSCDFYGGKLYIQSYMGGQSVIMENCKLIRNPLNIWYGNVVISEVSLFTGTDQSSAISSYFSNITLSGVVVFSNNRAIRGGAMALYSSTLNVAPGANVSLVNNSAVETGGAIYINPSLIPNPLLLEENYDEFPKRARQDILPQCFYHLLNCSTGASYTFSFADNSAMQGGDDIYGASLNYHQSSGNCNLTVIMNSTGLSSVSSDPTRVCLCDSEGIPQCKNNSYNYRSLEAYPGELFTVSAVLVGGDFGVTRGSVHANLLYLDDPSLPSLTSLSQYTQVINNVTHCSNLSYSLYGNMHDYNEMRLTTNIGTGYEFHCDYRDELCFLVALVFLDITLLPCPPGLTLLENPPICDCYPVLTDNDVKCEIINKRGLFSWNSDLWVNVTEAGVLYGKYCPFNYCNAKNQQIDLKDDSDSQCAFNRAGRLCGGCKEGYSLAIGSSHCIRCPKNNNLALLIFFAAAGLLLVFFISAFNLTVTQGMINGLIFYANVLWAHQGLLFPQQTGANGVALTLMATGRTFIAWLNLDFGIQICFFNGLTAFWKTWLQYLFPFYTAGLFFVGLRYFSKLAKLFGSRSVPTLATLLFLSYTKLLRNIIITLELSRLTNHPNDTSYYVWSIDGNLNYGQFPHITLLLMAIGCLLLLWLPYTMLLLLMQWLRRMPNPRISKWITRYKPVFDAYFAPLKDKHHYWFGVLLISRGILLISSLTANINPAVSPFLLHGVAILLLCYMNFNQVYKKKSVLILESAFLINLIILTGGAMYYNHDSNSSEKTTLICLSIGFAFIKFCGIVIWSIVQTFPHCLYCQRQRALYENIESDENTQLFQEREKIQEIDELRDSILNDSQLLPTY